MRVATASVIVALLLAACGSGRNEKGGAWTEQSSAQREVRSSSSNGVRTVSPAQLAPVGGHSSSAGPLDVPTALRQVVDGLGGTRIVSARVGAAPRGFASRAPWLDVTVKLDNLSGDDTTHALWETNLVEGAVAELANDGQADLGNVIAGVVVTARKPDGSTAQLSQVANGDVVPRQSFSAAGKSGAVLRASFRSVVSAAHMQLADVRLLDADGPAAFVHVVDSTPETLTARDVSKLNTALFGAPGQYAFVGSDLVVCDAQGREIVSLTASGRTGAFGKWISPHYPAIFGQSGIAPPIASASSSGS